MDSRKSCFENRKKAMIKNSIKKTATIIVITALLFFVHFVLSIIFLISTVIFILVRINENLRNLIDLHDEFQN